MYVYFIKYFLLMVSCSKSSLKREIFQQSILTLMSNRSFLCDKLLKLLLLKIYNNSIHRFRYKKKKKKRTKYKLLYSHWYKQTDNTRPSSFL